MESINFHPEKTIYKTIWHPHHASHRLNFLFKNLWGQGLVSVNQMTDYVNRGDALKEMCLYEYASKVYKKVYKKEEEKKEKKTGPARRPDRRTDKG